MIKAANITANSNLTETRKIHTPGIEEEMIREANIVGVKCQLNSGDAIIPSFIDI